MLGVPPTLQDGDTVSAQGGRLVTTSERGAGLRVLVGSFLSLVGLTAAVQWTVQQKSGTVALTETSDRHGFKNLLHNGRALIDQRATLTTPSTITTGTPTYGPDGWLGNKTNATMVATIGKVAVVNTPMAGSLDACKLNVTTLATVATGDSLSIQRRIEGTFFRRTAFGTAQAVPVYISFWAEASATGTFSVALRGAGGRSYVVNFTIAAANTRQLCQVTIPGDTTGPWATDTTAGAFLDITAAVGATFQTTAGAWQASNFLGTSSTTLLNNLVGSLSISDLYLGTEPIGTATTDYPHVPFSMELALCLRYYEVISQCSGLTASTTNLQGNLAFFVPKRAVPTITTPVAMRWTDGVANFTQSSAASPTYLGDQAGGVLSGLGNFTGMTLGRAAQYTPASASDRIYASSEL